MAKKSESSRVPPVVGSIPVVGGLVKNAETQAKWMQDLLEQNSRLVGQFPSTMKSFNDSLERFNQTIGRLDKAVGQLEKASRNLVGPLDRIAGALDPKALRELPETLESLRSALATEALPALRAATDTQAQVALLQTTIERIVAVVAELPGAGILRRVTARTEDAGSAPVAARTRRSKSTK